MKACPKCSRRYEGVISFCPQDGERLVVLPEDGEAANGPVGDPLLGMVLDRRYLLQRQLGRGGMGKVYLAEHTGTGRRVAVKVLHHHLSSDQTVVARLQREARAAVKINDPGVVEVLDAGEEPGIGVFYVMELLEGRSLLAERKRRGGFEAAFVRQVFGQFLRTLDRAHRAQVIHRDIKPENVFLVELADGSPRVKIMDFGIAWLFAPEEEQQTQLTQTGVVLGTPAFLSPEQAMGLRVTPATDIYSSGVMLYWAVTGAVPYPGPTPLAVIQQHLTAEVPSVAMLAAHMPPALDGIIGRAMAKAPEDRYPDAAAMAQALDEALADPGALRVPALSSASVPAPVDALPLPAPVDLPPLLSEAAAPVPVVASAPPPLPGPTIEREPQVLTSAPPPLPGPTIEREPQVLTSAPPPLPGPTITREPQVVASAPPPLPGPTITREPQVVALAPPPFASPSLAPGAGPEPVQELVLVSAPRPGARPVGFPLAPEPVGAIPTVQLTDEPAEEPTGHRSQSWFALGLVALLLLGLVGWVGWRLSHPGPEPAEQPGPRAGTAEAVGDLASRTPPAPEPPPIGPVATREEPDLGLATRAEASPLAVVTPRPPGPEAASAGSSRPPRVRPVPRPRGEGGSAGSSVAAPPTGATPLPPTTPEARTPPPPAPPRPAPPAAGTLWVHPWPAARIQLYSGTQKIFEGFTPTPKLPLPPGNYRLVLFDLASGQPKERLVSVRAGELTDVRTH